MLISEISPLFYKRCEYADLEYLPEEIYEKISKYIEEINCVDVEDLAKGKFEIIINWSK